MNSDDEILHKVVVNPEEQHSIWPAGRDNPPGSSDAGAIGTKDQCLDATEWTDMPPLSLRRRVLEGPI